MRVLGQRSFLIFLIFAVSILFSSCDNSANVVQQNPPSETVKPLPSEPVVESEPVPINSSLSGSASAVTGVVRFEGPIPKFKEIKMDADPICLTQHTDPVFPQTLVLGEGQTMGNVFVRIVKGLPQKKYSPPEEEVVLTQKGCLYTPHVFGVMVGQTVKILNPDGTLHNIHALSKVNPEFNMAMPKFRKELKKTFEQPEFMFPLKCDVHPWMSAWVAVMPHPYFTLTQEDGKYAIGNLPDGTYTIEAWHEKLGTKRESFTVEVGEIKEVNFTFARP